MAVMTVTATDENDNEVQFNFDVTETDRMTDIRYNGRQMALIRLNTFGKWAYGTEWYDDRVSALKQAMCDIFGVEEVKD